MPTLALRNSTKIDFPQEAPASGPLREWVVRGGNFTIAYTQAAVGDVLEHSGDDEYFLFVRSGVAGVHWAATNRAIGARTLLVVPPGVSRITVEEPSEIVRVFTARASITRRATDVGGYAAGVAELLPAIPWPAPASWSLKIYPLDDFMDKPFRLFRSPNLMVNIFDLVGPRDVTALTPHSHDDFEQGSLALEGRWVHSLRYPWSANLADWREDEHWEVGSPSLLIIPANVIHTSRAVSDGPTQLLDIFCPPRLDFSQQGLVVNADDFPMPD